MRLLVVTPLYHQWQASLDSILGLEKPCAVDYLMLANDDPHKAGGEGEGKHGGLPLLAANYLNICRKYNHARDVFLAGDYEALVCIEDDIIVPTDALKRLTAVEADIVYGLTCWRHGTPVWSARVPSHGAPVGRVLSEVPEAARLAWGQVIDVVGVGQACTLIRRRVLETLQFRLTDDATLCCDWWLAVDAQRHGFTQKADLGLMTGHIMTQESGAERVVWPTNEGRLWKVTAL